MDKIKEDKLGNILKNKDLIFITTVIYFAIITLYELFYCNFNFFTGKIENYNFSLYRIIMYIIIYLIYYKFKDEFIKDAVDSLNNRFKRYFIYAVIFFTIFLSILVIYSKNFSVYTIVTFISILIFNLFAIYISNNILKNMIITSLLFGTIFSISVTFNNQLDEKRHFLASYSIAMGEFNLKSAIVDESVADMPRIMDTEEFIKYFEKKPTKELVRDFSDDKIENIPNNYMAVTYLVSAIGIFISKIMGRKYCRYIYYRKNI